MRTEKETMHKVIFTFISIFISFSLNSQIKGSVVDAKNNALPFVNIYLKNSLSGTISNDNGFYELNLKTTGTHTIIFQFLGFKTLEKTVDIQQFPFQLNNSRKFSFVDDPDIDKLIIIDGKESDFKTLDQLARSDKLEEVDFLKATTAISIYGDKAKDGVIIAITKKE